jgi:hypothetical protein
VSEFQTSIEANYVLEVRSAFRQAMHRLEANRGFSPQEAREWMLRVAMTKKATLEAVAKAVIAGRQVEYRAGQFPGSSSPRSRSGLRNTVPAKETAGAAVLSESQPLSLAEGR